MKAKKLFYKECHLAGRQYHDCDEVFDELKVGTELCLVYDEDNRFDRNAVAVIYKRPDALRQPGSDEEDNEFLLGYIPRNENGTISNLLQMGWDNIFECRICKIDPTAHYEQQIFLSLKVKRRKG